MSAIPLADVGDLRAQARRTRLTEAGLGVALGALLVAAVVAVHRPAQGAAGLLAAGRSTVIVLDLSASVSGASNRRILQSLTAIAESNRPVGLVAFSDVAYELLPPGSPSSQLTPLLRYFTPLPGGSSSFPQFPASPWTDDFRRGTRISAGLDAGRDALDRAGIKDGDLLLISDLDDPQSDSAPLLSSMTALRRAQLPLRLVALFPTDQNRHLFATLVGTKAFVNGKTIAGAFRSRNRRTLAGDVPWALVGLAVVLVAALAVNERLNGRLALGRPA